MHSQKTLKRLMYACELINISRFVKNRKGSNTFLKGIATATEVFESSETLMELVTTELLFLKGELEYCSKESQSNLQKSSDMYTRGLALLRIIESEPEMYAKYSATACTMYGDNLPKDAFTSALNSHKSQITNIIKAHGVSNEDRTLWQLRLRKLLYSYATYKKLQKQVLKQVS